MNFGGREISNNNQSVKGKDRRAPLNNISARKNQMDYEQTDYNVKQVLGNSSMSDFNSNNSNNGNNILGMKQVTFGAPNSNKLNSAPHMQQNKSNQLEDSNIEKLRSALQIAIDENEFLRSEVTELQALYAAAGDEIEKRDKCILELVEQLQKMETESTSNSKQNKSMHKRTYSQ